MKLRQLITTLALAVGFTTAAKAATPVAVWDGDFDETTKGDYSFAANGNTVAQDGSYIEIAANVGVLLNWPAPSTTTPNDFNANGNITILVKYSNWTAGDSNGALATLWAGGNGSNNKDIVGPFTTASTGVLGNIWNGNTDTRGTKQDLTPAASGKFAFDFSGNTAPKGSTTYLCGSSESAFAQACTGNGTLFTTTKNIYGAAIGGSRDAYNNLAAQTGMRIEAIAIFNTRLSAAEMAAYQFPSEAVLSKMYSNRLSTGGENVPGGTYGAITVPGDGYKATKFTEATKISNTASGEEITGSYANIIKKPSGDTDIYAHTLMGWFKIDELPTAEGAAGATTIYSAKAYDGDYGGYKVAVGSDGTIYVGQCDNEAWRGSQVTTTTKVAADTWFHLAVSVPGRGSARTTTATVFINGQDAGASTTTFGTNLNGNKCEYVRISGGIAAAGIYVDTNAIVYPSLVVEAATTYVEPYVEPTEYQYTVTYDMTWTEIKDSLGVSGDFPENAQITLNVPDDLYEPPIITFDTTDALTGGLAFLKILDEYDEKPGTCRFALADGLYEDGCWSKTVFSAPLIEPGNATGVVKSGFNGAWTITSTEIALRAQNKEVISINIAGGSGGGSGAASPTDNIVSGEGFYGIAPTVGSSWNNIDKQWQSGGAQTIEIHSPLAYDGATTIQRPTMSLSATGQNTWQAGLTNPFLRGYLDDPGGVTVMVHGVPYTKYDVIVYATSDRTDTGIAPVTVNGTQYTMVDGETVEGDTAWGKGMCNVPAFGDNAMIIRDCEGEQLTISATRLGYTGAGAGRATLCAVQVINKGEVVVSTDYVGVMSGDVEWTDGAEDENLETVGDPWVSGEYSTITINNIAENGKFTFTQNTEGLKFKVVSEEGCALTIPAKSMVEFGKLKTYDFTEAAGGVTIELPDEAFDPSTLPQIEGGNWKFSDGGILVFDGKFPTAAEQTFFQSDDWAGTVWLKNVALAGTSLDAFCNENSILKFTGVTGWLRHNSAVQGVPTLELEDDGDTLAFEVTDSSQDKNYNFAKFVGDGTFKFATKAASGCVMTITDVSEFTGKLLSTDGEGTTARPIFVGTDTGTFGTTSLISVADGATINAGCGWEAESAAFGATLNVKTGEEDDAIVSGLTMEAPVYLATKVLLPDSQYFSCLGYEDGTIKIVSPSEFGIIPGENATIASVLGAVEYEGFYYAAEGAPVRITFTAKEGYLFPNGTDTLVDEITVQGGEEYEPTEEPVLGVAKIGDTYYLTLKDAFDAAQNDNVITVVEDCEIAELIDIDPTKSVTLDATGKTVTMTAKYPLVMGGAEAELGTGKLTIVGGTFVQDVQDGIQVWARRGLIDIQGGTFTSLQKNAQVVYSSYPGAVVSIYGGTFTMVDGGDVLNVAQTAEPPATEDDIRVYGGSFSKDPADGDDYYKGSFVADGYGSYKDGELWTVAKLLAVTVTDMPAEQVPEDLDAAFTYATEDTESAFTGGWKVDFYVSFGADVKAGAVTLKGQYGEYPWTGAALPEMTAGVEVPLMQTAGNEVSVENLLAMKAFNCGVANVSAPSGTTMTVVLKMYKKATGESFDLATKAYTLVGKGPTPAPGSDVKVDPLPGAANTYVVTPTGESKDLVIQAVADGATLIVNGRSVDSLTVDNKSGVNVVVSNRTDTVNVTDAVVGWGLQMAPSGLKMKAAATSYTWSNAIATRPVIDSFSFGESGEAVVGVTNTVNGLFYTLMRREELDYEPTAVTEEEMATGDTMTLTDDEPLDGKAFYEVKGAL